VRIGIVNDLRLAVRALRQLVESDPDNEVAWVAVDGVEAVKMAAEDTPDLILMDLIMPNLDGVEATGQIMGGSPCPILVVTATVEGNLHAKTLVVEEGATFNGQITMTRSGDGKGNLKSVQGGDAPK